MTKFYELSIERSQATTKAIKNPVQHMLNLSTPQTDTVCSTKELEVTAKRRLVPEHEVRSVLDLVREYGVTIGGIDVRVDGVTIMLPPKPDAKTEMTYAEWKKTNQNNV